MRTCTWLGLWTGLALTGIGVTSLSSATDARQPSSSAAARPPAAKADTAPDAAKADYPIKPVPFTAVHLDDVFWAPKIETNRVVTIPFAFEQCELSGRVDNFVRAAAALRGETLTNTKPPGYPFDDTDPYKVIEGASYSLSVSPDPKLEAYVDSLIAKIVAAQEKDGYLYTTRSIDPAHPHPWAGHQRWELEKVDSHELYNLGHLYEAAVAHYQATGKRTLLDPALRTADLLTETFGPGKRAIWPGHQITEMGLVKLYRVTGNERYLALAKFMLDARGPDGDQGSGREYNQSHLRVQDQTEAVGHAVRATYMYSGMADVAAVTGDQSYVKAVDAIWENVVGKKLYITGGIGATGRGEAFGKAFELPNMTAYNETCAAVGNDYWNQRLFLLHGDARFIDVMERTLYNGLISGVSLDGKTFFYPNPLESNGQHARAPWFGVACCPGNITRFLSSVSGYVYAQRDRTLFVNLYAKSRATVTLPGAAGAVKIAQDTRYPWDGDVRLTVTPATATSFAIKLRVPGWARNEPVPGDLYRFVDAPADAADAADAATAATSRATSPAIASASASASASAPATAAKATVAVNGQPVAMTLDKGYVTLDRTWQPGDIVTLHLPMPVRRIVANDQVEADRGRVALQRGPIVYTAEWVDNPNGRVRNLVLPDASPLTSEFRGDLLNGVQIIKSRSVAFSYDAAGKVTRAEQEFVAIPYYAWANRGRGQMAVWLPRTEAFVKPAAFPTVAATAKVTTSGKKNPFGVNDGDDPASSDDASSYFDWWPNKGTAEWIEYAFDKPSRVSEAQLYWFDDTGRGQVRVPASWRLLYKVGDAWKPVEAATDAYAVAKDRYNRVAFAPVTTSGLRLEVQAQPQFAAGVQEWKVK
jgi:DUF1680 family protein